MKKAPRTKRQPDMQVQYDFRKGIRCEYAKRYAKGSNVIVLDLELAKVFPDSRSVNETLHALVRLARKSTNTRENK